MNYKSQLSAGMIRPGTTCCRRVLLSHMLITRKKCTPCVGTDSEQQLGSGIGKSVCRENVKCASHKSPSRKISVDDFLKKT